MVDGLGRRIDYLRVSVTDRCNLRCRYCMPPEGVAWLPQGAILSYEEILEICALLAKLGVRTVRLTGGEPLVRRGLPQLVAGLKAIPGIRRVALTTNGLLLAEQLPALAAAGLDGVNISLDTLDQAQFAALTRRPEYRVEQALRGLELALATPGLDVKVNCVPMGLNDDQLLPLAELARSRPLAVRFIELMPIGLGVGMVRREEAWVRRKLEEALGPLAPLGEGGAGAGPARLYSVPGFLGQVGFISPLSHQFCARCNRVRLTATGFLKTCLQYRRGVELRPLLEEGEEALRAGILRALAEKPAGHHFAQPPRPGDEGRNMNEIGG